MNTLSGLSLRRSLHRMVSSFTALALVGGFALTARAQIGCGWTPDNETYIPQTSVGCTITPIPGGFEFSVPLGQGRAEMRGNNLPTNVSNQWQGYGTLKSFPAGSTKICMHQFFGPAPFTPDLILDEAAGTSGVQIISIEQAYAVEASIQVGVQFQLNTIYDPVGNLISIYVNGSLTGTKVANPGVHYNKYGQYVSLSGQGPATFDWVNVQSWAGGNIRGDCGPPPIQIPITCSGVTASTFQSPNVPCNTIDGNQGTRWAADGNNQWIQYYLGSSLPSRVTSVKVAVYEGTSRVQTFDVQTSLDGTTFTTVAAGLKSSGTTLALEDYPLPQYPLACYVRLLCHGNSTGTWNSLTEVQIWGVPPPLTPIPFTWSEVAASTFQSPNVPCNTIDGDLGTRWSADGNNQWIQYEIPAGSAYVVTSVKVAVYEGTSRVQTFDVQTSYDGTTFTTVAAGLKSSGTTLALENYDLPANTVPRFVRLLCHGNSTGTWNSLTEVQIWGLGLPVDPPPPPPRPI